MIGVAIGLGNVWRFPYMMGQYGGSAFLIVYLGFTLFFAVPAVMAEWGLGRATRKGPIGAFSTVWGPGWGRVVGYLLLLTVLVANSYYLVVIANVIYSAYFSIVHGFDADSVRVFEKGLALGWLQYILAVGTLGISLYVIHRGLRRGIEVVSRIFVPFFLVTVLYLVFHALALGGALDQMAAFLNPNFSDLTAESLFAALGQAFFSLGLGGTFLLIYGSYLQDDQPIARGACWTGAGDAGAALLAGLFIVPTILVVGLDMTEGPRLIFSTLPRLFMEMPAGRFVGSLFMLALAMVAFLSNIAALEVLAGGINDGRKTPWRRSHLIVGIGLLELVLMLPSALDPNVIGTLDLVFGSGMQVLGSALAVLAITWGLGKQGVLKQIFGSEEGRGKTLFFFWLRWVVPGALFCILIGYIYASIR